MTTESKPQVDKLVKKPTGIFTRRINSITQLLSRATIIIGMVIIANIASDLLHSDVSGTGEVVLYETTKDGRTKIGKITGGVKKSPPKKSEKLTMASLGWGLDNSKQVEIKRRTFRIFGMDVYLGGGATITKDGNFIPMLGVTVLF